MPSTEELLECLELLKTGKCWCEPVDGKHHTYACNQVRAIVARPTPELRPRQFINLSVTQRPVVGEFVIGARARA
jgi:hypothetical protein